MHSPIPDWLAVILNAIGWAWTHPVLTVLIVVGAAWLLGQWRLRRKLT